MQKKRWRLPETLDFGDGHNTYTLWTLPETLWRLIDSQETAIYIIYYLETAKDSLETARHSRLSETLWRLPETLWKLPESPETAIDSLETGKHWRHPETLWRLDSLEIARQLDTLEQPETLDTVKDSLKSEDC